jgi:hypothetical protein
VSNKFRTLPFTIMYFRINEDLGIKYMEKIEGCS